MELLFLFIFLIFVVLVSPLLSIYFTRNECETHEILGVETVEFRGEIPEEYRQLPNDAEREFRIRISVCRVCDKTLFACLERGPHAHFFRQCDNDLAIAAAPRPVMNQISAIIQRMRNASPEEDALH